jgi:hypothetical protein
MDAWTFQEVTWLRPLEAERLPRTLTDLGVTRSRSVGLLDFAEDCLTLDAQLDREFEPLHRLGEELLARLTAPPGEVSARMA